MKNDPYFKFLAVIIVAGLILSCFNAFPFSHDHLITPPSLGGPGSLTFHQFRDAAKALIERTMSTRATLKS